jgi:hypothetical protein
MADHTISIDIKEEGGVKRIEVSNPSLKCKAGDRITWRGTDNVGRWAVAFLDRDDTPFASNRHYFTAEGDDDDDFARVTGSDDSYDYYVFCEILGATGANALFLDPKIVIEDAGGDPPDDLADDLRDYAEELGALVEELSETGRRAKDLQERSIALAREIEQASGAAGGSGQSGGSPVSG